MLCAAVAAALPAGVLRAIEPEAGVEPLKVIQTVEPSYPAAAKWTGLTTGDVHVIIAVDSRGQLTDWLVTAESDPVFARSAVDALQRWRYEPMRRNGVAAPGRAELRFKYSISGMVIVTMSSVDQDVRQTFRSPPRPVKPHVYAIDELDRPLEALADKLPEYPATLRQTPRTGKAVVDYYVDEDGRVRLPVIVEQDHAAFGDAVLAAASKWRFAAPRRDGRPAITRVAQEFTFAVRQ